MRFMAEYPLNSDTGEGVWRDPETLAAFCRDLERVGVDAIAFTDHPAPSAKWLRSGGHETFDPFAALCFCAAETSRIRLMTHLAVVPYRNPLLQARSMMTLDVLSRGRATFVLGTGYLRSEFAALGVSFDDRNARFDESVTVIRQAWTSDQVTFEGSNFTAVGQQMLPRPTSDAPDLWVGGNSRAALERLSAWGNGWSAMVAAPVVSKSARTPDIEDADALDSKLSWLAERLSHHGRELSDIDVMVTPPAGDIAAPLSPQQRLEGLAQWARVGVTWLGIRVPTGDYRTSIERVEQFAAEIISALRD